MIPEKMCDWSRRRCVTRQIPWLRVFVEGVVIVGFILLAFGIEAQATEGQEQPDGEGRYVLTARDKATGEVLAELPLPGRAIGAPMTYMVERTQYIALTVRGNPPRLVALTVN